jgi:predicted DNA-binding antitoxin AbrB/MazE fold protein
MMPMDREQDIHFVYENGVLRPEEPVNLPEGARGVAHIRSPVPDTDLTSAEDSGAWLKAQESAFADAWDEDEDGVYDTM